MSTERNKEISLSLIEALNTRDLGLWSRHLSRDAKAMRGWFYWDQLAFLAQLGITEQPGLFLAAEGF